MKRWSSAPGLVLGLLAFAAVWSITPVRADDTVSHFDFEQDTQGFQAISVKDGQVSPDNDGKVTVTHDKNLVKVGSGSLSYEYAVEAKNVHALVAQSRPPADAKSVRLWVRSSLPTVFIFSLRADNGASYELASMVPALEWTQISANLDEFKLSKDSPESSGKLDAAHVAAITVLDLANMLVNAPDVSKYLSPGPRQLWLDDLQFSSTPVPQSCGLVKTSTGSSFLVDNFETGTVRWIPIKVTVGDSLMLALCTPDATLRTAAEAAAPGAGKGPLEPGGKGLRCIYKRGDKEAFVFIRNLEHEDLSKADRLHICLNASVKSTLMIELKEKGGAKYQQTISPDDSTGWHTLDLPLSGFTLSQDSKDDDGKLDPDQITELSLIDGSTVFGGGAAADVTLDLDAIYFQLK